MAEYGPLTLSPWAASVHLLGQWSWRQEKGAQQSWSLKATIPELTHREAVCYVSVPGNSIGNEEVCKHIPVSVPLFSHTTALGPCFLDQSLSDKKMGEIQHMNEDGVSRFTGNKQQQQKRKTWEGTGEIFCHSLNLDLKNCSCWWRNWEKDS